MARYDDLNTSMIAYAAVLSIVILVIVLQGTQALSYNMMNAADSAKEYKESAKSDKSTLEKREQLDSLNGFQKVAVIDETAPPPKKGEAPAMKKVIHIPIEDAKKLILKELGTPATVPAPGT